MRTDSFDYELPEELIASRPPERRDAGRLCVVLENECAERRVPDLVELVEPGDLLVLNETRVRRARLNCRRASGGKVELLFLRLQGSDQEGVEVWEALGRANKPLRKDDELFAGAVSLRVGDRMEGGTIRVFVKGDLERILAERGAMPIPPYLGRDADESDVGRYQTVFARSLGSAAAPTAGLHLTDEILGRIQGRGVELGKLVLHVGIGTFRPVSVEDLDDHPMHSEELEVTAELAEQVRRVRERRRRVIAVGTTVVRALEAARDVARPGFVVPTCGETSLLIQPGYQFGVVDALWTNFHMPRSTLLALVSAFAGYERTMAAYRFAVERRFRFLSYGDAMWIPWPWARSRAMGAGEP